MRYVLDSSVAFKWFVREAETDSALRLRDAFRNAVHELVAPDVFPIEIAHALMRALRQGRLAASDSLDLLAYALKTLPELHASLPLLPRAAELSAMARIGIYDCLYVALAEQEQCELVTADKRLLNTFQAQFSVIAVWDVH